MAEGDAEQVVVQVCGFNLKPNLWVPCMQPTQRLGRRARTNSLEGGDQKPDGRSRCSPPRPSQSRTALPVKERGGEPPFPFLPAISVTGKAVGSLSECFSAAWAPTHSHAAEHPGSGLRARPGGFASCGHHSGSVTAGTMEPRTPGSRPRDTGSSPPVESRPCTSQPPLSNWRDLSWKSSKETRDHPSWLSGLRVSWMGDCPDSPPQTGTAATRMKSLPLSHC